MKRLFDPRLDLGVRHLLPEWRALLRPEHLREDVIAGLTVACIAVPLSLAIALASGVPPVVGLVTAIVAGIVCALFGGTTLAVSGPAAALAVLVASIVQKHGMGALLVVVLCCGLLQIASGALGLGRIIRLVPVSVVEGFTAGFGALLVIGQLPRVLGLPAPPQDRVIDVITHIGELLHQARPVSVLIALGTLGLVFGFSRLNRRIPAALFAVAIPTIIVAALGIKTETIEEIPRSLPPLHLPAMPPGAAWGTIFGAAFLAYALTSLESLLSSSAIDKLRKQDERHDPDQEMIGQGLGNVASALAGGILVSGVIVRSALNVQAGARTRRAAIIHALALLAVVFLFAPVMSRIPVAALAGVLLSVAFRMLDPRKLVALARVSPSDAAVYAITFAVMVFADLAEGVQWGLVAALAIAALRLGQTGSRLQERGSAPSRLELTGPITFLASLEMEALQKRIREARRGSSLVLDATGATAIDATGAEMLVDLVTAMKQRDLSVALYGLRPDLMARAIAADHGGALAGVVADTEADIAAICSPETAPLSTRQRLVAGVDRYRRDHLPRYTKLFERLAEKQTPHTMLITCADSRIQPALMTSTDPGELFIVRNVGNMVPPYSEEHPPPAGSALEYAVGVLGVKAIILCAHSRCGAIHALTHPDTVPPTLGSLRAWLDDTQARRMVATLPSDMSQDDVARLNALLQLDHVRTFPLVRERVEAGTLRLYAWFFDVASGEIEEWSADGKRWRKLTDEEVHASTAPPEHDASVKRIGASTH
ncbi:Carbonic anhydrase [Minicystis rosea]|nr:Carbonic anhydrase [Minicystis rosea]